MDSTSANETLLPVGTIIAYAGVNPENFEPDGWMICDGRPLEQSNYKELFQAIGNNFGKPSTTSFNIPNLAGIFLRGAAGTTNNDPDKESRTAMMAGGATKGDIGSFQLNGVAPPKTSFQTTVSHLNISEFRDDDGCADPPAKYNSGDTGVAASSGGDKESRPINNYVYFLIKTSTITTSKKYVLPPIGAVVPFAAGKDKAGGLQQNWLICDGSPLSNKGVYGPLYNAIGFSHGKVTDTDYVLPDYRGYFLRGVANGSDWDPNRDQRTAPYKDTGNAGDKVGSLQTCATGLPTGKGIITTFSRLPTGNASKRVAGAVNDYSVYNDGNVEVTLTTSGGDKETRPLNIYVDWYIRFA